MDILAPTVLVQLQNPDATSREVWSRIGPMVTGMCADHDLTQIAAIIQQSAKHGATRVVMRLRNNRRLVVPISRGRHSSVIAAPRRRDDDSP